MNEKSGVTLYLISVAGEIPLKSRRTRPRFFRALEEALKDALGRRGVTEFSIWRDGARVFLKAPRDARDAVAKVFGVGRVCEAVELSFSGLEDLAKKVADLVKDGVKGKRFAVRVRRTGTHDFTSLDVARKVGELLLPHSAGVDLENPEVEVKVEVRGKAAYVIRDCVEGPGGLPPGTEGRVLALFSGGFDSPVAAWFVAKRGAEVHFLHFVLGSSRSAEEAFKVASRLAREWLHGYSPRFIVVDFRRVTEVIASNVRRDYRQVVLRALMYEAASLLAQRMGFDALVTGEAIGQASSQTLRNLAAVEAALTSKGFRTLILRPLLGMDKEEIMAWARRIGTYELSEKVAEYCAIAPSMVTTRAKVGELLNELSKVDESLIRASVREAKVLNLLKDTPLDAMPDSSVEIDYIPEGAIVVDMRSRKEYEEWHYPGAIHISEAGDLRRFKGRTVVLYCAHGNASYLVAEMLRREGVKAFSVKGGIRGVRRACGLKS